MIARQDGSKATAGRALERAQPEYTLRLAGAHFADRLVRQAQQPIGIGEQGVPLRRKTYGAPLAAEQPGTEMFFQLADARRHIGLDAIEFFGRTDDPALINDGSKDLQGLQIDHSHAENHLAELFNCSSWSAAPSSAACDQISTPMHTAPRFRSRLRVPSKRPPWPWPWGSAGSPSRRS